MFKTTSWSCNIYIANTTTIEYITYVVASWLELMAKKVPIFMYLKSLAYLV